MYIVFHDRVNRADPEIVKFDDLAKIEDSLGMLLARERTSKTPFLLARKVPEGWMVRNGEGYAVYKRFWTGNNTEVYAALAAIASGEWAGPAAALIARDTLEGRDGVAAARERLASGMFI